MQTAAVNILVKELRGNRSEKLYAVPTALDGPYYAPGFVIVKKQTSILAPTFEATRMKLADLLTERINLHKLEDRCVFENFTCSRTETVKGMVNLKVNSPTGALLTPSKVVSNEFGLNVSGDDKIQLTLTGVYLDKVELDCKKLYDFRAAINLNHPLIREAHRYMEKRKLKMFKRHKTLCLVIGCVRAKNDFEIKTEVKKKNKNKVNDTVDTAGPDVTFIRESDRETTTTKSATINEGTIVAYEIRELDIDEQGRLEVLLSEGSKGKLRKRSDAAHSKPSETIIAEAAADAAVSCLQSTNAKEKRGLHEVISLSIEQKGNATDLIEREIDRCVGGDSSLDEDDLEEDGADEDEDEDVGSIPLRELSKFTGSKKIDPLSKSLDWETDARLSSLKVLSTAMADLPVGVTRKLVQSASGRQTDVENMLRSLIDEGKATTESRDIARVAEKLGCQVSDADNGSGAVSIEKPVDDGSLVNAFVVAQCLKIDEPDGDTNMPVEVAACHSDEGLPSTSTPRHSRQGIVLT